MAPESLDAGALRALRLEAELTQQELSYESGLDAVTLSRWERGEVPRPQRNNVQKVLAVLSKRLGRRIAEADVIGGRKPRRRRRMPPHRRGGA